MLFGESATTAGLPERAKPAVTFPLPTGPCDRRCIASVIFELHEGSQSHAAQVFVRKRANQLIACLPAWVPGCPPGECAAALYGGSSSKCSVDPPSVISCHFCTQFGCHGEEGHL